MGLSLGVHAGSKLKVADKVLSVTGIDLGRAINILIGGNKFEITEKQSTEVLPNVFVSYGANPDKSYKSGGRLCFEAPRSIRISRMPAT